MANKAPADQDYSAKLPCDQITISQLDPYIGALCIDFNNLERELLGLIQVLTKTDHHGATAVWAGLMWKGRLELIESLMKERQEYGTLVSYWSRLFEFLREVGGDRNHILHGHRTQEYRDGTLIRETIGANFSFDLHYGLARRSDPIDLDEIKQIILDIRAATIAVQNLVNSMLVREPSPEKLSSAAVRRRPPRHLRKSKSGAAPQTPPQSFEA